MVLGSRQRNVVKHLAEGEDAVWQYDDEDEGRDCSENEVEKISKMAEIGPEDDETN